MSNVSRPETAIPDKQFFKIGEVAELLGVKAHVLRYWESEFGALRPMKTRGAHRMYRRADVELAALIRRLLYEEGYTIPGAKRRVRELRGERAEGAALDVQAVREVSLRAELLQVRAELQGLLDRLDGQAQAAVPRDLEGTATVTAVVPRTVLLQRGARS
jgi:DNA-binding transcriptional MerR regulator